MFPNNASAGDHLVISVNGRYFQSNSALIIDGGLQRSRDLTIDSLIKDHSSEQINAELSLAANTRPGAHSIAVGSLSGISNPLVFYVRCAGCPPAPRLDSLVPMENDLPSQERITQGNTVLIRFFGAYFRTFSPTATITGDGVRFDPDRPAQVFDASGLSDKSPEYFELPLIVAPDASTGIHFVTVYTGGGPTATLELVVGGTQPPAPRVSSVDVVGGCLEPGLNKLVTIQGYNFVAGTEVNVSYFNGGDWVAESAVSATVESGRTIYIYPSAVPASFQSFEVVARNVNGQSEPFSVQCSPASTAPILTKLTPSRVTRGTTVFVKCEGSNFGLAARVTAQGSAGSTTLRSRPVKADPDKVIVPLMGIGLSASPTIMVQVVDGQGKVSNSLPLAVDDPVAGKPFLGDPSSPALLGGIRSGGDINSGSKGKNLQGINDQSWSFSFPGHLTFSSTALDSSGQFVSFHVHADATTPLSADEATNLTVTTPAGQSNPVAFEVIR